MMKIAIIGGSGFIGSQLTKVLLEQGHKVSLLDINKSRHYPAFWIDCDIRDKTQLLKSLAGHDVVYNLAAEHKDNVLPISKYYDVNVSAGKTLCDVMDNLGIKTLMFTSTVAVYGFPTDVPDEECEPSPFNDYGKSKAQAERVYQEWAKGDADKRLVMVRPTAVFGPGNRGNVYNLIHQIASGKFLMLGNGRNKKSLAYIENVAGFLGYILNQGKGVHIFNYIDKPDFTMTVFVNEVRRILGKPPVKIYVPYIIGLCGGFSFDILSKITQKEFPISRVRVQKFCGQTIFNADKVDASGYKPPIPFAKGLEKTITQDILSQ